MFRKDLTKKGYIVRAVTMSIFYIIGIIFFFIGIDTNFLLTIIGLLCCGMPFAISFYKKGKKAEDNEEVAVYQVNDDGSYYRVGGWKKFVLSLIGLVLGLILTPINIIYYIYRAIKIGQETSYSDMTDMARKLNVLTNIPYNTCVMAIAEGVKESNFQTFKAGYPQNYDDLKVKCYGMEERDVLRLALIDANARNEFLKDYPTKINKYKEQYKYLYDFNLIKAYEKGKVNPE